MPTHKNIILKFNQYVKSDKTPRVIYADLEHLIKKIDNCKNNPDKFSTTKIGEHIPCGYLMSTIWAFDNIENKHSFYEKDFRKKFCISLKEHAARVINFEKKKMLSLTEKELKSHQDSTICYICTKKLDKNLRKIKSLKS